LLQRSCAVHADRPGSGAEALREGRAGAPAYEFDQLPVTASDSDKILALLRNWAHYRKYTADLEAIF
jgi:hypothetical protein